MFNIEVDIDIDADVDIDIDDKIDETDPNYD